jgi:hypothetical protein
VAVSPNAPPFLQAASLAFQGASLFTGALGIRETLDANARIAGFNAAEQERLLPLNIEAIRADIQAVGDAADFRQRELTEEARRAQRQRGLGDLSLEGEIISTNITREQVVTRSGINTELLGRTLAAITLSADEQIRQLRLRQRDRTAEIRSQAAVAGVAIESGSVEAVTSDIGEDFEARIGVTEEEAGIRRAEATLRNTLELSSTTERLAVLDRTLSDLELEGQQIEFLLEDSLFDAALQEEVNERNRSIAIDRLEREEEIVRRRAEIGIQSARERQEFIEDEQDRALIGDILSAGSFGVSVLDKFPTLAGNLGTLLGLGSKVATGTGAATSAGAIFGGGSGTAAAGTGSAAAAAGASGNLVSGAVPSVTGAGSTAAGAATAASGVSVGGTALSAAQTAAQLGTAAQFASGVGATLGGTAVTGGFTTFGAGTVGGLGGSTTAFATGAGVTGVQALGIIAPPVAAILALAAIGGAFSGPGNTPAAREQAGNKVTDILTTANPTAAQLERAKALLGVPNNFSDPNPGTIANFGGVENFINKFGGIDALSPGAREVFQLALDKRTKERAVRDQAALGRLGITGGLQDIMPNSQGETFGNTAAGQLLAQGMSPSQVEQHLQNVGSGA